MRIKELITELLNYDQNLEILITDSFNNKNYHTNNISIEESLNEYNIKSLNIEIGGCSNEENYIPFNEGNKIKVISGKYKTMVGKIRDIDNIDMKRPLTVEIHNEEIDGQIYIHFRDVEKI